MIGFLGGLINHYAQQRQLFVNIQRRQSFGFLRPTLADTESLCIRVSLGLEIDAFDSILIDSLTKLDELLGNFDFIKNEHETVKACNKPCEKSRSKTGKISPKTGNFLCKSMRSPENKWQALFDAQNILNKHSASDKGDYVSSAFDEYLKTVIIDKANKKAADIKSTGYKVDLGNITTKKRDPAPLANQPIVFKVLKNLVDFSVEYIANIELLEDKNFLDQLKHCYWHNLLKLHSNLEKAQLVLNNLDNYEITHLSAKATLLIENIQEYLILLDGLRHLHAQSNGRIYSPTSELKDSQRNYVASQLNIKQEQIEVYYTDSGQQANVASILAMDIQTNPDYESGKYLSDRTVYVFDNSYYELAEFFKNVNGIRSEDKNTSKIAFIDIRYIDSLKTTDFPALEAVIIDITHNSSLTVAELNTLAKELLAKNKWVVFTSSTLKHEEIGLDKYQSGRMIVMSPAGEKLNPDIAGELNDISDHAMHPLIASYLKMAGSVYQSSCISQPANINVPVSDPAVNKTAPSNSASTAPPQNNQTAQPLQGILPDGTKLSFMRIANNGLDKKGRHGSCGFIALNTTREEVLTSIKAHLDNEQVRSYISAEIDNDYQADFANLHLSTDNMKKLKLYKKTLAKIELQRIQLINQLKAHTTLQEANEDDLIKFFTNSNLAYKSTYIRQLRCLKTKLNAAKTKLNTFLTCDGLINDYLDRNIPNEWIGANIALAWAKASNKTLRIWAHKNQANASSEIYLRQSVQGNANPIIDILHTLNGTHYERLRKHEPEIANVQMPQVKADQAPMPPLKLTPQEMNKENNPQNIKIPKIYSQKNKATLYQAQENSTKKQIDDHLKISNGTKLTR